MSPVVETIVWLLDIGLLSRILFRGEVLIKNDRERIELDRENHRMAKERYEERATWRAQKRKQQERKAQSPSETVNGPVPSNGGDVAKNL